MEHRGLWDGQRQWHDLVPIAGRDHAALGALAVAEQGIGGAGAERVIQEVVDGRLGEVPGAWA